MTKNIHIFIVLSLLLCCSSSYVNAQLCNDPTGTSGFLSSNAQVEFIFNSISDYIGGKSINGAAQLKITINDDGTVPNCGWKLSMNIENGGAPTPPTKWEDKVFYGSGTIRPDLQILDIRVDNFCSSCTNCGNWIASTSVDTDGKTVVLIDNPAAAPNPAGTCTAGTDTDGPGNYIANFSEFSFIIDIRIDLADNPTDPGNTFAFTPGIYEMNLNYVLEAR